MKSDKNMIARWQGFILPGKGVSSRMQARCAAIKRGDLQEEVAGLTERGAWAKGWRGGLPSGKGGRVLLDTVDFGGVPAGGMIHRRPSFSMSADDVGKILLRNSQNVKEKKKRWHEEKSGAPCNENSGVEALMGALSAQQPSLATIVGRAHEASMNCEPLRVRSLPRHRARRSISTTSEA